MEVTFTSKEDAMAFCEKNGMFISFCCIMNASFFLSRKFSEIELIDSALECSLCPKCAACQMSWDIAGYQNLFRMTSA